MGDVCDFISRMVKDLPYLSTLDMALIRFCQLNDVLGSVSRMEKPLGPDFSAELLRMKPISSDNCASASCTTLTDHYDQALSIMWQWATLQQR